MSKKKDRAIRFCRNFARALPEILSHLSVVERQNFFRLVIAEYCPTCGRKRAAP